MSTQWPGRDAPPGVQRLTQSVTANSRHAGRFGAWERLACLRTLPPRETEIRPQICAFSWC
jgi:hypothetical protein